MKTSGTQAIPATVNNLIERWQAEGCPVQPAIEWPRKRWIHAFPNWETRFNDLPVKLSRLDVLAQVENSRLDVEDTEWLFLAVMAWGFGRVGYGVWRTSTMLDGIPDAPVRLLKVREILRLSDAISGYESLCGICRIPNLGPAFGTKYLYFLGSSDPVEAPLILDKLVASWLNRNTDVSINSSVWSVSTYRHYLFKMRSWAAALHVSPVDLESCIFQDEVGSRINNQWAKVKE